MDYIKLSHDFERWSWFDTPLMVFFWLRIILMANTEDRIWHGIVVKKGSFITTVSDLATELNLSVKQVRTCIERLKNGKEIVVSTANNKHLITICEYDSWHSDGANEGQINGKCSANVKNTPSIPPDSSLCSPTPSLTPSLSPLIFPQEKKESSGTDVPEDKKPLDLSFVLDLWNSYAKRNVPKVRSLTQARRDKVKLRIKEMGGIEKAKETLDVCFKKISESDFCTGANGKWAANFDWFFRSEEIWLKVLEGNYDNRKEKTQLEQLAELYQQGHEHYGQRYGYGSASPYGNPARGREDGPDEQ